MRILSIDPGETSAFVLGHIEPNKPLHISSWGTWAGLEELARIVESSIFEGLDVIVIEDYRVYPHKAWVHVGSQVYTAKEIGRIEWFAFKDATNIVYQMASQAKGRWPDSRMRMYPVVKRFLVHPGLKRYKGKRKHIIDAYRHLLTYLETVEEVQFDNVIEGKHDA